MVMSNEVLVSIISVTGTIVAVGLAYLIAPKKSPQETTKMVVETTGLTETQQLQKDKFCQEQLESLERKFKELTGEFDGYRAVLKEVSLKLDETEIKYHEALITITFLNIELAAYKT